MAAIAHGTPFTVYVLPLMAVPLNGNDMLLESPAEAATLVVEAIWDSTRNSVLLFGPDWSTAVKPLPGLTVVCHPESISKPRTRSPT
jgi:hypothetical protein